MALGDCGDCGGLRKAWPGVGGRLAPGLKVKSGRAGECAVRTGRLPAGPEGETVRSWRSATDFGRLPDARGYEAGAETGDFAGKTKSGIGGGGTRWNGGELCCGLSEEPVVVVYVLSMPPLPSKRGGIDTGEGIGRGEEGLERGWLPVVVAEGSESVDKEESGDAGGSGTSIARAAAMFLCLRRVAAPEKESNKHFSRQAVPLGRPKRRRLRKKGVPQQLAVTVFVWVWGRVDENWFFFKCRGKVYVAGSHGTKGCGRNNISKPVSTRRARQKS